MVVVDLEGPHFKYKLTVSTPHFSRYYYSFTFERLLQGISVQLEHRPVQEFLNDIKLKYSVKMKWQRSYGNTENYHKAKIFSQSVSTCHRMSNKERRWPHYIHAKRLYGRTVSDSISKLQRRQLFRKGQHGRAENRADSNNPAPVRSRRTQRVANAPSTTTRDTGADRSEDIGKKTLRGAYGGQRRCRSSPRPPTNNTSASSVGSGPSASSQPSYLKGDNEHKRRALKVFAKGR